MTASVKNAADEKQVKQASSNAKFQRDVEVRDIIDVLSTPQGRRLIWRIIEWSGCEGTAFRHTNELTYMAIGSGDVGRWIKSEIISADEKILFKMMEENVERKEHEHGRRTKGGTDSRTESGTDGGAED